MLGTRLPDMAWYKNVAKTTKRYNPACCEALEVARSCKLHGLLEIQHAKAEDFLCLGGEMHTPNDESLASASLLSMG